MNRRKYISAILGTGGLVGFYGYNKIQSKATLTGFRINNTDEDNVVSLSTGSESIKGLNLNFDSFNIETNNISQIDKDMTVNFYAKIDDNDYSDSIESINVSLSNHSEFLNSIIDSVIILDEDLIGGFPTVDEDMKELYIKIEMNHDDFSNPEIFETNISLNIEKQDIIAEGGDEIYDVETDGSTYRVHAYTEVGEHTFEINTSVDVDILIVGGGGGACTHNSGGAGAGGLVFEKDYSLTEDNLNVVVGEGGLGKENKDETGDKGGSSKFSDLKALGGGGGGSWDEALPIEGGSGAGGNAYSEDDSVIIGKDSIQKSNVGYGYGNSGGDGYSGGTSTRAGGGGGGAGNPGQDAEDNDAGDGGDGLSKVIIDDIEYDFKEMFDDKYGEKKDDKIYFAGGGGGVPRSQDSSAVGVGGLGGGGDGYEKREGNEDIVNAMDNTGGGGGAREDDNDDIGVRGGDGGSGIVLVRYKID